MPPTFAEQVADLEAMAPRWLPLDHVPDGTVVYGPAQPAAVDLAVLTATPRIVSAKLRRRFGRRTLWLVGYGVPPFVVGQPIIWARPAGVEARPVAAKLLAHHPAQGMATVVLWDPHLTRLRTLRVPIAQLAPPRDPLPAEWPSALTALKSCE